MYQYEIITTEESSAKHGPCDVCGGHVSEVFYQTEARKYSNPVTENVSFTYHGCRNLFGHKECLMNVRRKTFAE